MAQETFNKIIKQLEAIKFSGIVNYHFYNEPLLDKRIFEIIDYAQKCGLKVYMITNGLLLNEQKIDLIA